MNEDRLAKEVAGLRAKLLAEEQAHEQTRRQVTGLRDLLARLEWAVVDPVYGRYCAICEGVQPDHAPGCDLAAALGKHETAAPSPEG